MIVLAKMKQYSHLPDWALCCSQIKEAHTAEEALGTTWKVDLSAAHSARAVCSFCGFKAETKAAPIVGAAMVLLIDLYDLDEGEASL